MKKNYTSPKIKLIKVNTENVMTDVSSVETGKWDGSNGNHGIDGSTGTWDGNSQPTTAKGNDVFIFWEDEN